MKLGTAHQWGGLDRRLGQAERPQVPGYRVLERLGGDGPGGFEVWKAEGPGGFVAALRFSRLENSSSPEDDRRLDLLRRARHPNLLATFGAWRVGRSLVLASELPDRTLWDDFLEANAKGARGLPRDILIDYLGEAARGIDYLNGHGFVDRHVPALNIPHGAITPRTILFVGGGVKVSETDAGRLVRSPLLGSARSRPCHESDYASPERLAGRPSRQTDQYSLAVVYVHLRGGRLPFPGHALSAPEAPPCRVADLSLLPVAERPAVARALHDDPDRRWPSCRAFVDALRDDVHSLVVAPVETDDSGRAKAFTLAVAGAAGAATLAGSLFLAALSSRSRPTDETTRASLAPPTNPTPPAGGPEPTVLAATPPPTTFGLGETIVSAGLLMVSDNTLEDWPEPGLSPIASEPDDHVSEPTESLQSPTPTLPRLRLDAPGSLVVEIGKASSLPVRVACDGLTGPAEVSIEGLPEGLTTSVQPGLPPISGSGEFSHSHSQSFRIVSDPTTPEGETLARLVARCGSTRTEAEVRLTVRPSPALSARRRAESRASRDEHDQAIAAYSEAIALDPADPLAFHGRGLSYYHKGQYSAALDDLDAAIRLKPDSASALNNRGLVRLAGGTAAAAIVDFDAAIRLNPAYAVVRYNRGRAFSETGDNEKALADFDETLRIDPGFVKTYKARADVLSRLGDPQRAEADYDEAIRMNPDDPAILNNRGLLLFSRGEHHRAIADFDEAIRRNPGDSAVRYNRGRVYALLGNSTEALASFDQAIRLDPTLKRAYQARDAVVRPKPALALPVSRPSTAVDLSGTPTPRRRLFRQSPRSSQR